MFSGFDLRMIISYIINLNIQGIMEILKMVILDLLLLLIFFGLNKDSIIIVQISGILIDQNSNMVLFIIYFSFLQYERIGNII